MVQLTDDLVALLDAEAARRKVSRSALIRQAVEEFLHDEVDAEIGRQIAEGYRRIPQDAPDEWGTLLDGVDDEGRIMMRRLEAEEDEVGFKW